MKLGGEVRQVTANAGSDGGIMTAWIVGQTDRFAAAVAERFTIGNFGSYGVDDTPEIYEKDFGLHYDEKNFELYRRTSNPRSSLCSIPANPTVSENCPIRRTG